MKKSSRWIPLIVVIVLVVILSTISLSRTGFPWSPRSQTVTPYVPPPGEQLPTATFFTPSTATPTQDPDLLWINDYKHLINVKSWWDTVDFLAVTMVGSYMRKYPDQIIPVTKLWMDTDNIWLYRTCILFQLKYKKETNFELLDSFIQLCLGSKEFFINKAIGWALREYSKSNPQLVSEYVESNNLAPLSKREAMKVIERNRK